MELRLDKCNSFAMIKRNSLYCQVLPNISINASNIPPTPIGASFRYLGRIFDFDLKGELEKKIFRQKVRTLVSTRSALTKVLLCSNDCLNKRGIQLLQNTTIK